jgi:ABC-2 type transport system permease protein
MLGRGFTVVIRIWIFTQLYTVSYNATGVQEINGQSVAMIVWGLMLAQSFQSATRPSVSRILDEEVKSGTLAYSMSRPYSYILFQLFAFIGRSIPNLLSNLLIGTIAALVLVGPIIFSIQALILGFILLIFGYLLDFFISIIIGLMAFWIEDTTALRWIYEKGQLIFGGVIVPIALFPDSLQIIANILPFSQLYYGAARLMINFEMNLFWQFLAIQIIWISLFALMATYLFKKGIKNVSINGG